MLKGISASFASFICCFANGIPIIVTAMINAKVIWQTTSTTPLTMNQIMFSTIAATQPPYSTSRSNGHEFETLHPDDRYAPEHSDEKASFTR